MTLTSGTIANVPSFMAKCLAVACFTARCLAAICFLATIAFRPTGTCAATEPADATAVESLQVESRKIDFIQQVQPILAKRCFACHGPNEAEAGLKLSDEESAFAETDSGEPAIVRGDADASALLARVTSEDEADRMPPEGDPLSPAEVEILRAWIDQGAVWNKHWAFKPMVRSEPPAVEDPEWSKNPVDAFLFYSLAQAGLKPNPPADRATLIRRAYFDLLGLPPTAQQVQQFVDDPDPNAYDKLIDQLLDSPHYGERWGRHWLDLVRYAETNSFERDGEKPNAWKYRDYVIKSFNDDKPYDQFLREQLAGDELQQVTTETLTATGYYRLGIWDDEPADPLLAQYDELDDIIMTTGQVMLGLTLNCSRCHDHKIDPLPQKDYYSFVAMLGDVTSWGSRGDQQSNNQIDVSSPELSERYRQSDEARRRLESAMQELEQTGIAKMSAPDQRATEGPQKERQKILDEKLQQHLSEEQWATYQRLEVELRQVKQEARGLPPRESVMGLGRCKTPEQTFVLYRGSPHSPADPVEPDFPGIFQSPKPESSQFVGTDHSAGRRRVLAQWVTSPDNRLTARVIANRIWQFHFGRGLVRSSNNFGQLGTPPTHPELLDWLAIEFIEEGWRFKAMHRQLMTSRAYQMSSASRDDGQSIDPANDRFWRFDPRRLSAEEVRDAILAANGSLNRQVYGPSFYPSLSQEVLAGQSRPGSGWGQSSESEQNRRSVYIHVKRSLLTPLLTAFDFPDPDLTCEERFVTLQPGQALSLLNSEFIHQQAARLADSIEPDSLDDDEVIRRTIRAVLSRSATDDEIHAGGELIAALQRDHALDRRRAVELYCLTVLNWNEFLFVD
jgi:mono/diheme cytochrome c family protein